MRYPSIPRTLAFALGVFATVASASPERRFTVRDSIELSTFVYPVLHLPEPRTTFSPDGKHFVAVTMRGDLESGRREATMWLFDSAQVRDYLRTPASGDFANAKPLARRLSASNREPLTDWRWSTDSQSILFLGADDEGTERLYRVNVQGGEAVALSTTNQDVSRFEERNGSIVYLAHTPIRDNDVYQAGGSSLPDMEVATGKNVLPLIFPNWMDAQFHTSEDELWRVDAGVPVAVLGEDRKTPIRLKDSRLILSPDGHRLVATTFVKAIPKSWERYQPLDDYPGMRITADTPETEGSTGHYRPKQYALIDLNSGKSSLLMDSPIELLGGFYNRVLAQWNDAGSQIALTSIYPTLDTSHASVKEALELPCAIGTFDLQTRKFSCAQTAAVIDPAKNPYHTRRQLIDLQWQNNDRELVAQYVTPDEPGRKVAKVFAKRNDIWVLQDKPTVATNELSVDVHEALDEPPTLVASIRGGESRRLFNPNSQLKDIALGKAELYRWKDAEGNAWEGALVTPPEFSKSRRYPLVIQTHGLDRAKYLVDGPSATGFAARSFAARDIVVLQVQEIGKNSGTPKESETGAAGYRAAIKQLASDGVVDPAKVGIITWSHYGPHAMQGLIDEPHAYAAGTWAEAAYNSYGEYLINIDYMGSEREKMFRAQFGAKPFGEGLKSALEYSAGFHTDRVCTPMLFQVNSPVALIYSWDAYAALRAQQKPVDLFYIRNGDHVLVKPRQRLAEQGMNVDWYDYWLNGHKDSDPAKIDQYKRWDAFKTLPRCDSDSVRSPANQ